ncbi:MAG: hypothetical protein RBS80_07595 [Thermoguttaceae bacterium]|nr:hypothetical protein [Thermoguttaceae bacterium]
MKRRDFLAATLLAGPLALRAAQAASPSVRIGIFRADVTPPPGAPLCHGSIPPAKVFDDPLTARGIVLLGADAPIVLCAVDWVGIGNGAHDAWRAALAEAAGTTPDRVSVHVVHQHTAPGVDDSTEAILKEHGLSGAMFDPQVAEAALRDTVSAVSGCLGDAQPVTHVGFGRGKVEKFASNRRILGPDGKIRLTRMSSCRNAEAIAAPEGIIDPFCKSISFFSSDRPLAVLTYYATHPQSHYGGGLVSADTVGVARQIREAALPGVAHVHFNGAGGDIAAGKYNDGSPKMREILGERLAEGMRLAWEATRRIPVSPEDVDWTVCRTKLPLRDSVTEESSLIRIRNTDLPTRERLFAVRGLVWLRRMQGDHELELGCLRVGPVRVLHMPGELCIEYQLRAEEILPDAFVAMAAYGDIGPGYICTEIAYSRGGYETGRVSRVAPRVEGVLHDAMRQMLRVEATP